MEDKYYELAKELGIIEDDEKCCYGECVSSPEYPEKEIRLKENILLLVEELQGKQETINHLRDELERERNRINYLEHDNQNYWDRVQMLQNIIDNLIKEETKDECNK